MKKVRLILLIFVVVHSLNCSKNSSPAPPVIQPPAAYSMLSWTVDTIKSRSDNFNVNKTPVVKLRFGAVIDRASTANGIVFTGNAGSVVHKVNYENADSTVVLQPSAALDFLAKYKITVSNQLKSKSGGALTNPSEIIITTRIDSSRKFPLIADNALLDSVQKRTFKYFWDLAHPVSGMIRERNSDAILYTSGGTGFGIMAIVTAIHRNFITRHQGLTRLATMVSFLKNT